MRILGVDPGLSTTGIGLVDATQNTYTAIDWLTITTNPGDPLTQRLGELASDFEEIVETMSPEFAVVEQVFFAKNERTAIAVAHARGVLLSALGKRSIPVLEATPMQLKAAITGDGNADKKQIGSMLCRILNLREPPRPADAADALALAVYGAIARPATLQPLSKQSSPSLRPRR